MVKRCRSCVLARVRCLDRWRVEQGRCSCIGRAGDGLWWGEGGSTDNNSVHPPSTRCGLPVLVAETQRQAHLVFRLGALNAATGPFSDVNCSCLVWVLLLLLLPRFVLRCANSTLCSIISWRRQVDSTR